MWRKSKHTFYAQQLISDNRAIFEIWHMHLPCWIPKVMHKHMSTRAQTHAHAQYV